MDRLPPPATQRPAAPAPTAPRKASIFIISAPSGAGKSTLCKAVLAAFTDMRYSVSFTTRAPRPGEENGRDYVFVTASEFEAGIRDERWAEWAQVHGNYYGTSAAALAQCLASGWDILLDIDVQGAEQICARFPESVTIFVMPPSLETLRQRLVARGTDRPEVIAMRIKNAEREMAQREAYRHVVVNDDLERAIAELIHLIASYRGTTQADMLNAEN
jgi:guanylate kinase